MKRRAYLGGLATTGAVATAGCLETILDERRLATPITATIEYHGSGEAFLIVRAVELDSGRESYEEELAVTAEEGEAHLPHLRGVPQEIVVRRGRVPGVSARTTVDEDTQHVHVVVDDDGIEISVSSRGEDDPEDDRSDP